MLRPVLIEIALFLIPFAVYALFLWATRAQVLDLESWPVRRTAVLALIALVLMAGSFVILAQFSGAPPDTTYTPAHIENGRLVPGHTR